MSTVPSSSIATPEKPKRRSTGKPGVANSRNQVASGNSEAIIAERIKEAQTALWRAELSRSLLVLVVSILTGLTLWSVVDHWIWSPGKLIRTIALLSGVGAIVAWVTKRVLPLFNQTVLPEYAAHSLEHDLPELRHSLTSYVSLRDDQHLDGVRGVVVRSIGVRAAGQLQHHDIEVPSEANTNLRWWLGVAAAIAVAAAYALLSPKDAVQSSKRLLMPLATIEAPRRVQISDIEPGDTEALLGHPLEISAVIDGLPSEEQARVEYGTDFIHSKSLELSTETRRHRVSILVDGSTSYRIVGGDAVAGPFEIRTRNVPVVNIDHVQITPPEYTKLEPRQSRGGAIVGEENSIVKISGSLNLPIKRARIEFNPRQVGERVQPTGGTLDMTILREGMSVEVSFPLRLPVDGSGAVALDSYRLHVWDLSEIENLEPIVYPIRIVADLKPEISITSPQATLTDVPVNGAQRLEVQALDPDYGLKQIDIKIARGVHKVATETIWSSVAGERGNQNATWVLQPSALGLRVGETIQVIAISSDNRHDASGKLTPNYIASDPIELKIVAAQQDSRPELSDNANEKPEDGEQSGSDESKQPSGGKDEKGQGGSGQGQQGQSGQGESAEKQEGQEGQKGQGQSGENKNDESGDGQSEKDSSGGGGAEKPTGDGKEGNMESSSAQDGQQQPSETSKSNDGNPGAKSNSTGESDKSLNQSPQEGEQNGEAQGAADQKGNAQATNGGAPQKPQHDGDAFERIRDFLNENDDNQTQAENGDSGSKPDGSESDGSKSDGSKSDGSKSDGSKDGEQTSEDGGSADGTQPTTPKNGSDKKKRSDGLSGNESANSNGDSDKDASGEQSSKNNRPESNQAKDKPESPDKGKPSSQESGQNQGEKATAGASGNDQSDPGKNSPSDKPSQQSGKNSSSDPSEQASDIDNKSSKPEDAKRGDGEQGQGDQNSDNSDQGSVDENGKPSQEKSSSEGQPAEQSDQPGNQSQKANSKNGPDSSETTQNEDGASGTTGGGDGGDGINADMPELAQAPDPVNLDEAKKATELVLDYLDRQRDKPDPELLKELDWSPDELRAFADRWNRIRDLEKSGAADNSTVEEALRSLGIRENRTGPIGKTSDTDDGMRGLKDGGNRVPAPIIYQDAFESFRRNVNRERSTQK